MWYIVGLQYVVLESSVRNMSSVPDAYVKMRSTLWNDPARESRRLDVEQIQEIVHLCDSLFHVQDAVLENGVKL